MVRQVSGLVEHLLAVPSVNFAADAYLSRKATRFRHTGSREGKQTHTGHVPSPVTFLGDNLGKYPRSRARVPDSDLNPDLHDSPTLQSAYSRGKGLKQMWTGSCVSLNERRFAIERGLG